MIVLTPSVLAGARADASRACTRTGVSRVKHFSQSGKFVASLRTGVVHDAQA